LKIRPIACLICLLPPRAFANDEIKVSVARMSGRTAVDASLIFYGTVMHQGSQHIGVHITAGLGIVRWDSDRDGEGRIHADASIGGENVFFSIGPFVTSGASGGPALGARSSLGYHFRHKLFLAGYWEYAQGLPSSKRGGRAGAGLLAGFSF